MAEKRIQQYPEKVAPSTSDYLLIADAEDVDVNGYLKYKKLKISGLDNIVITNAEDITLIALNNLISTNSLVVGRFYRITDSLSGINPIIVQAVALNVLSELAIDSDTGLVYTYVVSTDTVTSFPSMNVYVPYVGATASVDLGEYQIKVGQVELDQTPTQSFGAGKMRWNDTDGTAEIGLKGGNVTLQIGQEQLARVVNKTGSNLTEASYKVVRISGAQGQRLKVGLAQANSTTTSKDTLGLVTENISNNQEGFITTSGLVRGIDTTGSLQGETWADGDRLYLSSSVAGGITKIEPSAPNLVIVLGYVVYAHASQGSIYVSVEGAKGLHELFDVSIPSPTNNNVLVYESSTSLWKDKSLGTIIGGSSSQFVKGDGSLDSNTYLTTINGISAGGELSGTYPNPNLVNSAVTGKVLTGLSVTGSAIVSTDSILTAFGKLQNQVNALVGGVNYRGTWNASTNNPALASGVGTQGYYYVVSVAGSTNLDGITDWKLGDWAIYNGTAWQKVDNTDAVVSVNGYTGIVTLAKADVGLGNVENTALSTWVGSSNIVNVGTITSGTWNGTAIGDTYISSASTWNAKIGGSGTTGKLAKFTSSGVVGDSIVSESGGDLNIGGNTLVLGTLVMKDDNSEQFKCVTATDPNMQLIAGYSLAGNYGYIQSIQQGSSVTPLQLQPIGGQIITNSATNTGEHFIVGGSARVNGETYLTSLVRVNGAIGNSSLVFDVSVSTNNNVGIRTGTSLGSSGTAIQFHNDAVSAYTIGAIEASTLLLNSVSGGNVGIGTTSPLNTLVSAATTSYNSENTYAIAAASYSDVAYKLVLGFDTTLDAGVISSVKTAIGWKDTWINPNGGALRVGGAAIFSSSVTATKATFTALPTSSAGLSSGDLWNDSGTVKIV